MYVFPFLRTYRLSFYTLLLANGSFSLATYKWLYVYSFVLVYFICCGKENGACLGLTSLKRSEEHTSELQSRFDLVCRLLLEKKKKLMMITTFKASPTHY